MASDDILNRIPRHRRRRVGAPGAPAAVLSGEIAANEVDAGGLTVYWGQGDDGSGNATSATPVAGQGFVDTRVQASSVASIAALRALPFLVLAATAPAFAIEVKSYYAGGSGAGGGRFVWDAAATAADDGGLVINPTGNTGPGRFRRNMGLPLVTPEMFGGQRTAVPIAGQMIDCTAALQAAVNTGYNVRLTGRLAGDSQSIYYVSQSIKLTTSGQVIRGDGRNSTYVYFDSGWSMANGSGVFVCDGSGKLASGGPCFDDFSISGFQPEISGLVNANSGGYASFSLSTPVNAGATVLPFSDTSKFVVGQYINGGGVATDSRITAISANASITISAATTGAVYSVIASTGTLASMSAQLLQISGIDARNTYNVCLNRMRISACYRGIDMRNTAVSPSGQFSINCVDIYAFFAGLDIDGVGDSVRVNDLHYFPFNVTMAQAALAAVTSNAFNAARMDDLKVSNSLAIGCRAAFRFYQSALGGPVASITNFDFDICYLGVDMSAGNVQVVGGYCVAIQACVLSGGANLSFTGVNFPNVTCHYYFNNLSGNLSIVGSTNVSQYTDKVIIQQNAGNLILSSNKFGMAAIAYANPQINIVGGTITAVGNYAGPPGAGTTGFFFQLATDDAANCIVANGVHSSWASNLAGGTTYGRYEGVLHVPFSAPSVRAAGTDFVLGSWAGQSIYSGSTAGGIGLGFTVSAGTGYLQSWAPGAWKPLQIWGSSVTLVSGVTGKFVSMDANGNFATQGNVSVGGLLAPASATVGTLPTGIAGTVYFASNGRNTGEGAGAGTGCLVTFSNGAWRRQSDNTQVAA